jgi:hypothetical protein
MIFIIMVIITISGIFINYLPYSIPLFFSPLIIYAIIYHKLKNRKKITPFAAEEFKKKGYEIISERSLGFIEGFSRGKFEIKPTILINNLPFERYTYITQFQRIFTVANSENKIFEIHTSITKKWNGKVVVEFLEKPVPLNNSIQGNPAGTRQRKAS